MPVDFRVEVEARLRRRSTARKRSRNCATGGKRSAMCAERDRRRLGRERPQRARPAPPAPAARAAAPTRRRERRRPEPEEAVALASSRSASQAAASFARRYSAEPPRRAPRPPPRARARQLGLLVREEPARLQLEQRRDEHEELAARLEVELARARRAARTNATTIPATSTSAQVELLLQDERQQQVERALERVEVQLELAHDPRARNLAARPDAALGIAIAGPSGSRRGAADGRPRPVLAAAEELPPDEERGRADEDDDRDPRVQPQPGEVVRRVDPRAAPRRSARSV